MLRWDKEMSIKWNFQNIWGAIIHPFRRTFQWIVRSIQYSIFLWNNHDWDFMYFMTLLQYKIRRMRKEILKGNHLLNGEEVAAQMKHVEDLIQRWYDDDFCKEERDAFDKKWGEMKIESVPIMVAGKQMNSVEFTRKNATTPELKDQERKEQSVIWDKEYKEKERCLDEIFIQIRKHVQNWWD